MHDGVRNQFAEQENGVFPDLVRDMSGQQAIGPCSGSADGYGLSGEVGLAKSA